MLCVDQHLDGGGGLDSNLPDGGGGASKPNRLGGGVASMQPGSGSICIMSILMTPTTAASTKAPSEPPFPSTTLDAAWQHLGAQATALLEHADLSLITTANLAGNRLSEMSLPTLQKAFSAITNLTTLNLSHNNLGENTVKLLEWLDSKKSLRRLDISYNALSTKNMEDLCHVLCQYTALETLDISMNPIKGSGVCTLLRGTASTTPLVKLLASQNGVCDADAEPLSNALHYHSTNGHLEHLSLVGNQLTDKGVATILDENNNNSNSLVEIDLRRNRMTPAYKSKLQQEYKTNKTEKLRCAQAFVSAMQHTGSAVSMLQQDGYLMQTLCSSIWPASDYKTLHL